MSAYSSAVLALSPINYWRMNASSGATETDLGSAGANLAYGGTYTLGGSPLIINDATAKSVFFNGGIATGAMSAFTGTGDTWGVVLWYETSFATQYGVLAQINGFAISHSNSTGNGSGTVLTIGVVGAWTISTGFNIVADGKPHQIAFVYNAGNLSVLHDNVAVYTTYYPFTQYNFGGVFGNSIAGYSLYGSLVTPWAGNIAEVSYIPNLTVGQTSVLYLAATKIAQSFNAGARLVVHASTLFTAASRIVAKKTSSFSAGSRIVLPGSAAFGAGAAIKTNALAKFSAGARLINSASKSFAAAAHISNVRAKSLSAAAVIVNLQNFRSFGAGAFISTKTSQSFNAGAFITPTITSTSFGAAAFIVPVTVAQSFAAAAFIPVRAFFHAAAYIGIVARAFADRDLVVQPKQRIVDAVPAYTVLGEL